MRILDIDMDFFLDNIANWLPFSDERLLDSQYSPWNEKDVRRFFESNCGLSLKKPISGRIVKEHKEAYYFWRELIRKNKLTIPFDVTHIDAHSDLGGGDGAWVFIFEKVLNMPIEERTNLEKFQYRNEIEKFDSGNYLLFAAAAQWIKSLIFICHPKWDFDYYCKIMKDSEDNSGYIQMKRYKEKIDFSIDYDPKFESDCEIEFNIVRDYRDYIEPKFSAFDYLVFSKSPSYTPASADFTLDVIKDYINII